MDRRLKSIYKNMKSRCYNPNVPCYKHYGGRGITICDEWLNSFDSFEQWALSNGYADSLTIDRIDNDKDYSPSNCRWVSQKEQCNNKRTNYYITYMGCTKTLMEWCDELNLSYGKISSRIHQYNMSPTEAFESECNLNFRMITYKGESLPLKDWCKKLGLNYHRTASRLNNLHWTVEEAFCKSRKNEKLISYKGRTQSIKSWCKELGLNYYTVQARITKCGWSVERALEGR